VLPVRVIAMGLDPVLHFLIIFSPLRLLSPLNRPTGDGIVRPRKTLLEIREASFK
jgi:hypothetical protein